MINLNFSTGQNSENNEPRYDLNQIDIIKAITDEISSQCPGIKGEPRLFNAVIKAANIVVDEFAKQENPAVPGMGLTRWLASDDVGRSSKYMAWLLNKSEFDEPEFGVPADIDDFRRCMKMVAAIGVEDEKICEVLSREVGYWRAFGKAWLNLISLHENGKHEALDVAMAEMEGWLS